MLKRITLAFLLLIILTSAGYCATTKYITMKDGSVIKGEIVSFENGTYTVQTENLGQLQLADANVVSIAAQAVAPQQAPSATAPANTQDFSGRVSAMQNQIMSNPEAFQAVQAMAEDPEIASMVSDPEFVKQLTSAVSSGNIDSVAGDARIQQLMGNPKMQALIEQLQQNPPQEQ